MLDATVVNVALPHIGEDFERQRQRAAVGADRLPARAGLAHPARRRTGRSVRAPQGLRDRHGVVRRRVAAVRRGAEHRGARRRPGAAGRRRRPASPPAAWRSCRRVFVPADRAKAVGAWSGLGGVAGAIGPFVGGWLVDGPGWRWAFLINLPVAALAVGCALYAVPETRDPHAARALDLVGAGLAVISLGTATWALTEAGPRGWTDPAVIGAGIVALVGIAAFVRRMRAHGRPARAAVALPQPRVHGDEPGDRAAVRGHRRLVLPGVLRAAGRGGLVGPRGGDGAAAGHAAHAPALGQIGRAGAAHRAASRSSPPAR